MQNGNQQQYIITASGQKGVKLLTRAANGNNKLLKLLVPQADYVQVYVANESDTGVLFKDMVHEHR